MKTQQKIKTVIVEDLPHALDYLLNIIDQHMEGLDIVGTADNVLDAAKLIKKEKPQLLLLDIELGQSNAFDLLDIIPEYGARVIFTTAAPQYALKAFDYAALDYILKPVEVDRLVSAIQRVSEIPPPNMEQFDVLKATDAQDQTIALVTLEEIQIVPIKNIIRLQAEGNYTKVYLRDGSKTLVSKTLKSFDNVLADHGFIRSHQSHLVNRSEIKKLVKTEGGYLILKDGTSVPVSARKRQEVVAQLKE